MNSTHANKTLQFVSFETAKVLLKSSHAQYLDSKFIDRTLRSNKNFNIDYFEFSERASELISKKIAKTQFQLAGIDEKIIAQALWFLVWTELCNIIPIRSAIKNASKSLHGRIILIPIHSEQLCALELWVENPDLLPLLLYSELAKMGYEVLLVMPPENEFSKIEVKINPNIVGSYIFIKNNSLFCPKSTRGTKKVLESVFLGSNKEHPLNRYTLSLSDHNMQSISLTLREAMLELDHIKVAVKQTTETLSQLNEMLGRELLNVMRLVRDSANNLINQHSIKEANICDHLFLDTAIVAGCVRSRSGKVHLWPHSSSMSLYPHHKLVPAKITRIYKDKETKHPKLRSTKFNIRSDLMLSKPSKIFKFEEGEKQNIVIISGAAKINQMPMFDIDAHEQTVINLLNGLKLREEYVNIFVRPKGHWTSISWFQQFCNTNLHEAPKSPADIDLPNMTFLCISQSSTALLEGVGRGIPGLFINEIDAYDPVKLDKIYFPALHTEKALQIIDSFNDPEKYKEYWHNQSGWFGKYAKFRS